MTILSRTTNRSPKRLVPPIAPCASGADAGWRPERSPTRRAVGRQGVFPPQVRAQVTAIACNLPKQCKVPLSRWSRAELARHVVQDPSLPPISASTVGRWLKARSLATVLRESPKRRAAARWLLHWIKTQVRISSRSATVYTFFPSAGLT